MFGTFSGWGRSGPPVYGPGMGESALAHSIGMRGYDGGIYNGPFNEDGRVKAPFTAPGPFNPFMFQKPRRRRLNLVAISQVLALPTAIFAVAQYLFGFSVRNNAVGWCWFFLGFCILLSLVFLVKAFLKFRKQREERWTVPWYLLDDDDTWYLYLGVCVLVSALVGAIVGDIIFGTYTYGYYTLSNLHAYTNVDPIAEGKAYLDAGAITFHNRSYVDVRHAVGYKDGPVYCVAPIRLGSAATVSTDFWAVGKDCCSGFAGSFNCFEKRNDASAHGALRIIDDADIAFYKLAQLQATGEFKEGEASSAANLKDGRMNTVNPIFLTWMKDPIKKIRSKWDDAIWTYWVSFAVFCVCELIAVSYLGYKYWSNRLWG